MTKARFGELLVNENPRLLAYAVSLSREADDDDLVQQTLVRSWASSESFQDGTNLQAWLI